MTRFKTNTNFWVGIIFMVFAVIALFFIAKGIFIILSWAAPVLFILTLIFRYQVVLDYGKGLINLVRKNPVIGIVGIILTIVAFPIVAFILFGKALLERKVDKMSKDHNKKIDGEYVDYEEIDNEPLELPDFDEQKSSSKYEDFFKNQR